MDEIQVYIMNQLIICDNVDFRFLCIDICYLINLKKFLSNTNKYILVQL